MFNDQKGYKEDRKFIERNMYKNKMSKNTYMPLIVWSAIGIALFGFGIKQYSDIKKAEISGDQLKADALTDTMYSIGGTTGILIAWGVIALCAVIYGYQQYRNKMK